MYQYPANFAELIGAFLAPLRTPLAPFEPTPALLAGVVVPHTPEERHLAMPALEHRRRRRASPGVLVGEQHRVGVPLPGRWWELLRPDRPDPDDRFAPGIEQAELRALVSDLERMGR